MTPILRTENLSKYYINGQNVVAGLNRVNLSFHRGEFVAITGESGSGKSTLAHVLGGMLPYEDGELFIAGEPTAHFDGAQWETYRRDCVAFISQNYGILPGTSVYDNVASALRLGGMDKHQVASQTRNILEEVELWPMRRRSASRLSSGQKQRLAIARALAKPCPVLIADEPTGNLDPENSEKVIRLLAQAAKERLVILITHEFSEAADFVTRHIRIHDGVIAGDEALRPVEHQTWQPTTRAKRPNLGAYIAALQFRSRPVWCVAVLLFFALTAFAVFAFLGSFIVATDDTPTRLYQSDAFLNGSQDRIVAVRKDSGAMTTEDYNAILALGNVEHLERYGYLADTVYAYREGVDYKKHYALQNIGSFDDPVFKSFESIEVSTRSQFFRTVPLGAENFLTAGRLPENLYEVVAGEESLLGQTVTVYIQDPKRWSASAYLKLDMLVVGTTDLDNGLYFADDLAATLTQEYLGTGLAVLPWYEDVPENAEYVEYCTPDSKVQAGMSNSDPTPFYAEAVPWADTVYRPLNKDEVLISFATFKDVRRYLIGMGGTPFFAVVYTSGGWALTDTFSAAFPEDDDDFWSEVKYVVNGKPPVTERYLDVRIIGLHQSTLEKAIYLHPEKFEEYLKRYAFGCDQVSITITDYSYTDRVIHQLEEAGYYALSPYVLGSTVVDEELAQQRMQTLYVCLGALLAVVLLQMIVLRALFAMENEDYRILSRIGLTWTGARTSIWLQVLCFMALGQAVGFGLILVGSNLGVERLVSLTKYLSEPYWLLLSAVHIAVSVVAAKGILSSLKKKIYPQAARPKDLAPRRKEAAV